VIDELEGCGRKRSWPNLRYYSSIFLKDLNNTTNTSVSIVGLLARYELVTSRMRSRVVNHSTPVPDTTENGWVFEINKIQIAGNGERSTVRSFIGKF
jgi:hypothetical protein